MFCVSPLYRGRKTTFESCQILFSRNDSKIPPKVLNKRLQEIAARTDYFFSNIKCSQFVSKRYIRKSCSSEEAAFPIAYAIVIFKQFSQFERLLRAVYRPEHTYCVHVDKKSSKAFHDAARRLASCFTNVYVAPERVDVQWGEYSVLQVQLNCMKLLLAKNTKWKYFINLTGQEFPLRTNLELVRILKSLNGANLVEKTVKRRNMNRLPKTHPGFKIVWIKGAVFIVAQRGFVEFAINDWRAKRVLDILRNDSYNKVPDEQFFATLNHNPSLKVPGSYIGTLETGPKYPFLPRLVNL